MYVRILLLLLVLVGLPAWAQSFHSQLGRFEVNVPGEPVVVSTDNPSPMGVIKECTTRWRVPGLEWVVVYSDVPEVATSLNGGPLFSQVRRGFEKSGGRPISHLEVWNFGNYPGRSFDFALLPAEGRPARRGLARTFLAGQRLYVLTVTWDRADLPADRKEVDRFFDSFKLIAS